MGSMLRVTCRSCGEASDQSDGFGMASYVIRCDRCGRTDWRPDPWDASDHDPQPCVCGGSMSTGAPVRCLTCASPDVAIDDVGIWD